jgi:hypothetical protein
MSSDCKSCGDPCEIKISKSQKNPGKKYFACNSGCKIWNGWVDNNTTMENECEDAPKCKECNSICKQRTSKTSKNYGKTFWGCTKGCKSWNGWVDNEKKSLKRKVITTEIEKEKKPKLSKISITHHCVQCDKILDIEHEIQNNIKRYSNSLNYPKDLIYVNLKSELTDAITSGDYICEACLGNE